MKAAEKFIDSEWDGMGNLQSHEPELRGLATEGSGKRVDAAFLKKGFKDLGAKMDQYRRMSGEGNGHVADDAGFCSTHSSHFWDFVQRTVSSITCIAIASGTTVWTARCAMVGSVGREESRNNVSSSVGTNQTLKLAPPPLDESRVRAEKMRLEVSALRRPEMESLEGRLGSSTDFSRCR